MKDKLITKKLITHDLEVSFITDLNYGNYNIYTDEILSNVEKIARVSNLDIPMLSKLCGVGVQTLRRLLVQLRLVVPKSFNVRFTTINKLNNFVGDVLLLNNKNDGDA